MWNTGIKARPGGETVACFNSQPGPFHGVM